FVLAGPFLQKLGKAPIRLRNIEGLAAALASDRLLCPQLRPQHMNAAVRVNCDGKLAWALQRLVSPWRVAVRPIDRQHIHIPSHLASLHFWRSHLGLIFSEVAKPRENRVVSLVGFIGLKPLVYAPADSTEAGTVFPPPGRKLR